MKPWLPWIASASAAPSAPSATLGRLVPRWLASWLEDGGSVLLADVGLGLALAVFSLFRSGYRFNGADNSFYLPILYHAAAPNLYQGDYLFGRSQPIEGAALHFWVLGPTLQWLGLAATPYLFFGLYLLCLWAAFFAWTRLFRRVRGAVSPVSLAGLVLLAALADYSVGGVQNAPLDRYLIPRFESKVAGLIAFYLAATGRYRWSIWLACLGILLHPAIGVFMLAALLIFGWVRDGQLRTLKSAFQVFLPVGLIGGFLVARQLGLNYGPRLESSALVMAESGRLHASALGLYPLSRWTHLEILDALNRLGLFVGMLFTLRRLARPWLARQSALARYIDLSLIYLAVGIVAFVLVPITLWRWVILRIFSLEAWVGAAVFIGLVLVFEREADVGQRSADRWLTVGWPSALAGLLTVGAVFPYKGWIGSLAFIISLLGLAALGTGWWLTSSGIAPQERLDRAWVFLLFALGAQALLARQASAVLLSIGLLFAWGIIAARLWGRDMLSLAGPSRIAKSRAGLSVLLALATAYPAVPLILASRFYPSLGLLPERFLTIQWPGTTGIGQKDADGQDKLVLYRWIKTETPPASVFAFPQGDTFSDLREYAFRPVYFSSKDDALADSFFLQVWNARKAKNAALFQQLFAADLNLDELCQFTGQENIGHIVFRRGVPLGLETIRIGSYSLIDTHRLCNAN